MRLFVRYPDTCVLLVYKVTVCDLFLYAQFCALRFIAESDKGLLEVSGGLWGAVQLPPHCRTAQRDRNKEWGGTAVAVTLPFIFCQIYCILGEEGGFQKPVRLVMVNILCFIVIFKKSF